MPFVSCNQCLSSSVHLTRHAHQGDPAALLTLSIKAVTCAAEGKRHLRAGVDPNLPVLHFFNGFNVDAYWYR